MSDDVLVKVEDVSKKYCRTLKRSLWYGVQDVAGELFARRGSADDKLRPGEFLSLDNVSFELRRGECLGLIGANGAGKSTLLKILNGLIKPNKGRVEMSGRIGALIELGAGFNPILTGRENIYVNASVLGFSKKETDRKLDAIIDFAEIGEFIDTPVQNYSSGMKVRLGFAVAAQMEPDILLIDEVLAVGDVGFRAKCYNTIYDIGKNAAVIFVSHHMPYVARLCNKAILLKSGKVFAAGSEVNKIIENYFSLFDNDRSKIINTGANSICNITLDHEKIDGEYVVDIHGALRVKFTALAEKKYRLLEANVTILSRSGELLAQCNSNYNAAVIENTGDQLSISLEIPHLDLNPGFYTLSITLRDSEGGDILSWHYNTVKLAIKGDFYGSAPVQYLGRWQIT